MAHAHVGEAGVAHDAVHIRKVQVDEAGVLDQVGDAGDGLQQHVIGDLKSVGQGDLLVGGKLQAVIGDDEQRIHPAQQLLNAGVGLIHAALALKLEGLGHHAHGEQAGVLGDLCHHGGRAGAGAAAHAGGDEHHIRILHSLGNVVAALLRGALADLRIGAGALTAGHLLANLQLLVGIGHRQRLSVCIDGHKLHTLGAGLDHSVNNVVAGAADTNDLYRNHIFGTCFSFEIHSSVLLYILRHIKCEKFLCESCSYFITFSCNSQAIFSFFRKLL